MNGRQSTVTILMADDDEEDSMLVREALAKSQLSIELYIVKNGEELMDYLYNRGQYTDRSKAPRPGLILLDLNMPKKDGLEVLRDIKIDPSLRQIPVVVLTTSSAEEDIYHTYDLGANSFITKPVTFDSLVEVMQAVGKYWFEIVELPLEVMGGRNEREPYQSSSS
ncbi:response regulator [Nostocaceae cyanobacterium CENA369]|uniref:Response regulator n=1 Tax=Dendronalium phyllosphericum CENA369 TaxID=1725256 RepID=A0A8J7LH75_9NOST|nr:response regulator [Dendronalium phyllosphericum]MBH8573684.1 response regulator [Dendronalium phyllosphericum CENA369]